MKCQREAGDEDTRDWVLVIGGAVRFRGNSVAMVRVGDLTENGLGGALCPECVTDEQARALVSVREAARVRHAAAKSQEAIA
jgi:hypothetical protein